MGALWVVTWEAAWKQEGLASGPFWTTRLNQVWYFCTVKCCEFLAMNAPTPALPRVPAEQFRLRRGEVTREEMFPLGMGHTDQHIFGIFHVATQSILYSISGPLEGSGFAKQISWWRWFTSIQESEN